MIQRKTSTHVCSRVKSKTICVIFKFSVITHTFDFALLRAVVIRILLVERSKVSCLSMRTCIREDIDYQSAFRQQGLVWSSLSWKSNKVKGTVEVWDYRNRRTSEDRMSSGGSEGRRTEENWKQDGPIQQRHVQRWIFLRQMPMTGGRGEMWYDLLIYLYVNFCFEHMKRVGLFKINISAI